MENGLAEYILFLGILLIAIDPLEHAQVFLQETLFIL
jgi:hypothetical protein